ncbi:MAG: hypothetical protein ABSE92_05410 [Terriglobales bacterium]|jgi:hypothetical protein
MNQPSKGEPGKDIAGRAERIRTLQHQGKEILLVDFSGCQSPEIITLLAEVQSQIGEQAQDSVFVLADFSGAHVDRNASTRIKEVLVYDRPYVKKSAWVGTDSLPKVFYENFKAFSQRELPAFKTRAEAMEWLVGDQSAA